MRFLMIARMPHDEFNEAQRDGSAGAKLHKILEETKPEAAYFTELDGQRAAVMVVEISDQSKIPAYAEPWFLGLNADVEFRVAMTPADLEKAGLDDLAKAWS